MVDLILWIVFISLITFDIACNLIPRALDAHAEHVRRKDALDEWMAEADDEA